MIFITMFLRAFFFVLVASAGTWSGETRYGIGIKPDALKPGEPVVTMVSKGEVHWVDSAAVLDVPAEKIFEASIDYDHYQDFAPYVLESRIVETHDDDAYYPPSDIYMWSKMRYRGHYMGIGKTVTSMTYLHVQPQANVVQQGDFATRWVLEKPHQGWKFPTESYFSVLDGSWYIVPLDGQRTYVRYFLKVKTDTWIPNGIISSVLNDSMKPGVKALILAIAKRAQTLK